MCIEWIGNMRSVGENAGVRREASENGGPKLSRMVRFETVLILYFLLIIEYNIQNMSTFLSKVFAPLTSVHVEVLAELSQILFKSYFCAIGDSGKQEEMLLAITGNYLFISQSHLGQENNLFCPINFDLKFQVLRHQWMNEKTPGLPYGIRFEKGQANDAVEFYHNNQAVLQQWILILSKKINQRNFHKLFKAKKKIGKGAFATVYLAERLVDNKMVAVKAFSKEKQFSGDKGRESLENEIRIMRSIDHCNVTTLEEVYETDNSIYVILEYLEGKQLNDEIKNQRKFTSEETRKIIKQILMGLDHLDKKRIIHRDLKPQNIMFKYENSLELGICDFGLATYADEGKYLFVRCGTPGFVAPQIINIKDMTTKSQPISDVFSAGVIFHLLLFGRSIFPGKKYNDVLAQNRSCQFNFQSPDYQSLPQPTFQLLSSMLERDPKKRISAQAALCSQYFQGCKFANNSMEMEEERTEKIKHPLFEINLNQAPLRNGGSGGEKMVDENENRPPQTIGQSVKKKLSFTANLSAYRTVEGRKQ